MPSDFFVVLDEQNHPVAFRLDSVRSLSRHSQDSLPVWTLGLADRPDIVIGPMVAQRIADEIPGLALAIANAYHQCGRSNAFADTF